MTQDDGRSDKERQAMKNMFEYLQRYGAGGTARPPSIPFPTTPETVRWLTGLTR